MGTRPISQSDALTGVIAALPGEARSARRLGRAGWRITLGGVGAEATRAAVEALFDDGVERLLVWGTAGGLQQALRPGALIVAGDVLDSDGGRYPVSAEWQARLLRGVPSGVPVTSGTLVTATAPLPDRQAKTALAQQTGAVAVDMETAAAARLATEHGVPFAVLRAIVDPLDQALPRVVSGARPGRHFPLKVVLGLAGRPRDLSGVVALGGNMRAATRSLAAAARGLAEVSG